MNNNLKYGHWEDVYKRKEKNKLQNKIYVEPQYTNTRTVTT